MRRPRSTAELSPLIDGTTAQNYYDGIQGEDMYGVANAQEQALLDPNGDGVACTAEDLEFAASGGVADDGVADDGTTAPATNQYADGDMTALPYTGGPALLLPVAALLMVVGGLSLAVLRQR